MGAARAVMDGSPSGARLTFRARRPAWTIRIAPGGMGGSDRSILTIAGDSVQFGHISYNAPMPKQTDHEHSHGLMVETGKPEVARPPLYSVLLLNDDYTPMDFVVEVLMRFFSFNAEKATQIMLHVHTRGRGVCGVFTREVAESKVAQVNEYSRLNQHPLLCTMEKA
jgi:ATP-dependent Clp protease adaptor protein ClpS